MERGTVYNRIYNEEEWEEVNNKNKLIVEDFLEEYKQRKIKPSTISQYFNDLRIVLLYIKRKLDNQSILELTKKDFRRFSLWLGEDLKVSNARSNRLMSAVRSLLTYIEDDDDYDYDNNVAKKVKGLPKEPVKTNEDNFFITFEQVIKIRKELLLREELQLALLHMLSFDSGARRNEIYQVTKFNLLTGNKTNVVVGKRGKTFPLVYLNDTRELIKQHLQERGEDDIDSLWFVGKGTNKKSVTSDTLYNWVVKISKILSEIEGKEICIFPHSYRHSRAECLTRGEDVRIIDPKTNKPKIFTLEEVQYFLHHSDPKTTQGYTKDKTEEMIDNMFGF